MWVQPLQFLAQQKEKNYIILSCVIKIGSIVVCSAAAAAAVLRNFFKEAVAKSSRQEGKSSPGSAEVGDGDMQGVLWAQEALRSRQTQPRRALS